MECIYQIKGDFATNIISLCSTMARKGEVDDDYAKAWARVVVAVRMAVVVEVLVVLR